MDSVTQAVLGASIGEFLGGKKYGRKAAIVGAIVATIPDLDVFIGPLLYSDPLQAEFFHRSITHSILFSIIAAPLLGWILSKIIGYKEKRSDKQKKQAFIDRSIISFRAILTHWMLDLLTSYGTKWLRPFSQTAYAIDSVFIVDPLYTVPFMVLLLWSLWYTKESKTRRILNGIGLIVSTLYLIWGIGIKRWAEDVFAHELERQGIVYTTLHSSPEIGTTFLWRGRAEDANNRYTGWKGLFDKEKNITRKVSPKNVSLLTPYLQDENVKKLLARWNHRVVVRPMDEGVRVIPVQFGDLLGWVRPEETFMVSFELSQESNAIVIKPSNWPTGLPQGWFSILRHRIRGQEKILDTNISDNALANVGEACIYDQQCQTPMDYLIRSVCPFSSKCIEGICSVVCVDSYHTQGQAQQQCTHDEQCDCQFYPATTGRCTCLDGLCTVIVDQGNKE